MSELQYTYQIVKVQSVRQQRKQSTEFQSNKSCFLKFHDSHKCKKKKTTATNSFRYKYNQTIFEPCLSFQHCCKTCNYLVTRSSVQWAGFYRSKLKMRNSTCTDINGFQVGNTFVLQFLELVQNHPPSHNSSCWSWKSLWMSSFLFLKQTKASCCAFVRYAAVNYW